jgi:hypothetical protein
MADDLLHRLQWRVGGRAGIIDNGAEAARIYHAQRCVSFSNIDEDLHRIKEGSYF